MLGVYYTRPISARLARWRGGMGGASEARTLITVGVTADGSSARDTLEMDRQHGCCLLEEESRSASVL